MKLKITPACPATSAATGSARATNLPVNLSKRGTAVAAACWSRPTG
jgi:hypothetical protein